MIDVRKEKRVHDDGQSQTEDQQQKGHEAELELYRLGKTQMSAEDGSWETTSSIKTFSSLSFLLIVTTTT